MIFVERDKPLSREAIEEQLEILRAAIATEDNETVRRAMKRVVPAYHAPEKVDTSKMKLADEGTQCAGCVNGRENVRVSALCKAHP